MLSFSNIVVSIQGASILRRVSFEIGAGQTVALVGRNGAGKTTVLRTIMGLTNRVSGTVEFEGRGISRVKPHERPGLGIGYAPEDRRLFSAFTVEENIRLPAEVARLETAEIEKRLAAIYGMIPELEKMRTQPAGQVSGGQGKIVALGRALMLGTKLILLDEPFQGLAPVLAARYGEVLRALKSARNDISILVTESNPELLSPFADRTLVIERGDLSEANSTKAA
ncbi:MAG: ATP-binding cassette domain-containing protein [Pseudomonadota bacterium]